jgi:hypothetical protein
MYLEVLLAHAPDLPVDVVLADAHSVPDPDGLRRTAVSVGAEVVLEDVARGDGTPRHDPTRLAAAYDRIFTHGRIAQWR